MPTDSELDAMGTIGLREEITRLRMMGMALAIAVQTKAPPKLADTIFDEAQRLEKMPDTLEAIKALAGL